MADLVHAPLAHWAAVQPDRPALDDGRHTLSYAQLHRAVAQAADRLARERAPATVFTDPDSGPLDQVVALLAAVASGRCAAVCDPDWTPAVREAVRRAVDRDPADPPPPRPDSPFYIGFTSGSTGLPKGFRRHHRSWTESFRTCLDTFGPAAAGRILAPGRAAHSLFLFGMLLGVWSGGGAVLQDRFSAARALQVLRAGDTPTLVAVPSQLVMMLEWAARRGAAPIEGVRLVLISGARWMRHRTAELQALFPQARLVEFYGASETSFIAWMDADPHAPPSAVGWPFAGVDIDIRPVADAGPDGLLYVRSPMLFSDYVGQAGDATQACRDGDWLTVGDMGHWDAQGRLCLVGRQNRMLVTQGKNLFPEEVETVLAAHPALAAASVQGLADPVRGQQVVACVQPLPGAPAPTAQALQAWCRERLEAYKVPRRFYPCPDWPQTASGKTDHAALARALAAQAHAPTPCWTVWP
ncbi:AMP-binding protein [Aquabacterium sp. A08]|uniref:AMP-binding protein n=1 Tax=Aquabacterium sp. A08 TaxID=2718532 RepID=UPI003530123D